MHNVPTLDQLYHTHIWKVLLRARLCRSLPPRDHAVPGAAGVGHAGVSMCMLRETFECNAAAHRTAVNVGGLMLVRNGRVP